MNELTDQEKIELLERFCGREMISSGVNEFGRDIHPVIAPNYWNPLAETRQGLMDALDLVETLGRVGYIVIICQPEVGVNFALYSKNKERYPGAGPTLRAAIVEAALKIAMEKGE